jgi:nucleoside-diphosphate-sugar epimerase
MRIVVVGATGNVGTSVLRALSGDSGTESVLGLARRRPALTIPKVEWAEADVGSDDLVPYFRAADVVIHLAWLIQPSRDPGALRRTNVIGSQRVFDAVANASVPALVYASSVGAYSEGPKDSPVDESWATDGIPSSLYSVHKSEVERILDRFEQAHPNIRVVRLRPGLIFKAEAASEIRRFFAGPLLPGFLLRPSLIPIVPRIERLRFQAVHGDDAGEAYRLAATRDVRGAFNVAADPVLDPDVLGRALRARPVPMPPAALRAAAGLTWRLRLQPTPPGWLDLGLGVPIMDTSRAREELGWHPRDTAVEALEDLLAGFRAGRGLPTPPLDPATSGPARAEEFRTGVGSRG